MAVICRKPRKAHAKGKPRSSTPRGNMSDAPRTSDVSADFSRPPRTIVLCFDGTRRQYCPTNSNVVKFFGLLCKDCPEQQVAYYQAGVGTYFAPGVVSPLWTWLASLLDEALAWYLDAHVMAGYKYLMDNYRAGDKICLFGFSRGAFTARALAGMLEKVGLLPRDNWQQISFAYKAYVRTDKEGIELAAGFKRTFSRDVTIEFVGVWDTVQSTGIVVNRMLPFTDSNVAIRVFRHALSLDEHRARFRPNLYHWPMQVSVPGDPLDLEEIAAVTVDALESTSKQLFRRRGRKTQAQQTDASGAQRNDCGDKVVSDGTQTKITFVSEESKCTDVLEVWFAGCHSDIGGGNVQNDVKVSLAQITLHWMVEEVIKSQCGIVFDSEELARIGFTASLQPPNVQDLHVTTRTETTQDAIDTDGSAGPSSPRQPQANQPTSSAAYPEGSAAIAPLFDELKINKFWWILEILPTSYTWQDLDGKWHRKWSINWGRGRFIPFQKPKFHHTVKERIDYKPLKYTPRATFDRDEVYV